MWLTVNVVCVPQNEGFPTVLMSAATSCKLAKLGWNKIEHQNTFSQYFFILTLFQVSIKHWKCHMYFNIKRFIWKQDFFYCFIKKRFHTILYHFKCLYSYHCSDVIMGAIASQTTSITIIYSTVYSGADQRKPQSSASLAFVRGIHRWPVNSTHKGPVTRKMFRLMTSSCIFQIWIEMVTLPVQWVPDFNVLLNQLLGTSKWCLVAAYFSRYSLSAFIHRIHQFHVYQLDMQIYFSNRAW